MRHAVAHTFEMMAAATSLIMCGVCDRFPRLRIAFLESGGGWMAGWLDRMDRHFDDVGMNDTGLSTRPSEIFHRQCFISFEPVEGHSELSRRVSGLGQYPVGDRLPACRRFSRRGEHDQTHGHAAQTLANVLAGGAKRYYNLQ